MSASEPCVLKHPGRLYEILHTIKAWFVRVRLRTEQALDPNMRVRLAELRDRKHIEFWPEVSITALTASSAVIRSSSLQHFWRFAFSESRAGTEAEAVRQQIAM